MELASLHNLVPPSTADGAGRPCACRERFDHFGWWPDPLDRDDSGEDAEVRRARRLLRLAVSAVAVGARSVREPAFGDPVLWLTRPHRLFGGRPAVEAVQDRAAFKRCLLLHGLSLGSDADPADLDRLLPDADAGGRRTSGCRLCT